MVLSDVNIRIGAKIEALTKGLRKAERELIRSGRQMSQIGQDLTTSLTLPIAAAGAASVKFASDFEESFLKINTLVGVSGDTLDEFRQGIAELSGPLGQSQAALSDALFVITSAGQRGSEALETLEAASKASAIGLGNTSAIARTAVAAVQAYGAANLSSAAAVDKLTAIVRAGNLEASELAPALGRVLPVAASLGVSFDEVGANIATFTRLGVSASESVTALRSLLSNILKPSSEAAKELDRLGISADKLRASIRDRGLATTLQDLIKAYDGNTEGLTRLFGNVEGLANALGTAGAQGEEYLKIVEEIANSNGLVNDGFEKVSQTANFKLKQALVELQNVGVQFGGVLLPIVTDLLGVVTPLVGAFSKLPKPVQEVSVVAGGLLASAGPLVSVFGNLRTVAGTVRIAFQSLKGGLDIAQDTFRSTREVVAATGGSVGSLTGVLPAATRAWKSFNTVVKASIIGAAVTAVVALAFAAKSLSDGLSTAAKAQKAVNDVSLEAEKNIAAERVQAERLTGILKDNTASYEQKQSALNELSRISPQYFSNLSLEKSSVEDINKAYDGYIDNLLRAARAQAAQSKIVELEKERLQLENELSSQSNLGRLGSAIVSGPLNSSVVQITKRINEIEEIQKALANTATNAQIENQKLASTAVTVAGSPIVQPGQGSSGATRLPAPELLPDIASLQDSVALLQNAIGTELQKELEKNPPQVSANFQIEEGVLQQLGEQFDIIDAKNIALGDSFDATQAKLDATKEAINSLLNEGMNPYSAQIEYLQELQAGFTEELENTNNTYAIMAEQTRAIIESGLEDVLISASEALGKSFVGAADGGAIIGAILSSIANSLEQLGKMVIATGTAVEALKAALRSFQGIGAVIAGGALVALAQVVKAKAASLATPAFATGGIVRSPTLALVGDNPNANINPEYILRQDQLQTIADNLGGGSGNMLPAFRLDGDTLLVWYERAAGRRNRR